MKGGGEKGAEEVGRHILLYTTAPVSTRKKYEAKCASVFFVCAELSTLTKGGESYSGVEVG